MLKQYNVLTKCLTVINIPILPHIEKLRLEIQLILLKQLLLMQPIESKIRGATHSELEFEDLQARIEDICTSLSEDIADRLSETTVLVKRMTDELKLLLVADEEPMAIEKAPSDRPRLWK
ncbi:hypothetical protein [Geomesophilobacter sediminis]|uniref:Uncharacterized protein n=1 Tax=Geomesophilobacter sediminis TaxID=2798584 RepID=A0A8J7JAR7_9BACT|nr:hypothetical protein [Geomesophilobacter sediminis]MBJ6724056.1 hypothetical protein [Geomesophilobacter sediminis]